MFGSARRKYTLLVHNVPTLQDLAVECDNTHQHEPWGATAQGWATALETAYPWELCRAIGAKIALHIQQLGALCNTPSFALQTLQLEAIRHDTGVQTSSKAVPLLSEFKDVVQWPLDKPLPPLARPLSSPTVGNVASKNFRTIGIHRSPDEFVAEACEAKHPSTTCDRLPRPMQEAIEFCTSHSPEAVARDRSDFLRRAVAKAKELEDEERTLKQGMSERRRSVLAPKRMKLFQWMMEISDFGDKGLFEDVCRGFDLTGTLPESLHGYDERTQQRLPSSPVDPSSLPPGATLTRRFGVVQGDKVRPIDDYKASLVNASVTQPEMVCLHSVDHIAGMGAQLIRAHEMRGRSVSLVAKCWDLASAYKQVPLSEEAFKYDSFLVVFNPETGKGEIFQQLVLPFGSIASVTAFLRCALALWHIGSSLLHYTWTSYFDDFLSLVEDRLRTLSAELRAALTSLKHLIVANVPRVVETRHFEWVHLYVDAAFEPTGFSGIGGQLYDITGELLGFFSERVSDALLESIKRPDQRTVIFELEGLAIAAGLQVFSHLISGRRVVVFTDNQAAQSCIVKCKSANDHMDAIIRHICSLEENMGISAWLERVPSQSNPADEMSRSEVEFCLGLKRSRIDLLQVWEECKVEPIDASLHSGEWREDIS
eukprot:s44_g21.t1